MPKKRGSHKNRRKQQSSARGDQRSSEDGQNNRGPTTNPCGTTYTSVDQAAARVLHGQKLTYQDDGLEDRILRPNPQQLDDTSAQDDWLYNLPELTELTLWKISEVISPQRLMPLGLKLGLPQTKLMNLLQESNNPYDHDERNFKMLYLWYADQGGDQSKFLFQILTTNEGLDHEQILNLCSEKQFTCTSFVGRTLQGFQLWDIAEEVHVNKLIPLGLRLGLSYSKICTIRADSKGHSVDARYAMLIRWQKQQTAQIDQVETLAKVLDACQEGRLAYKIRQDHLCVTNEGKTLIISEDQPMHSFTEVQLSATHASKQVREEAQGQLQTVLDANTSQGKLLHSKAEALEFLEELKALSDLFRRHSDLVKHLMRSIGRDKLYQLIGLTVDSIHFHVKVYSIEGLQALQRDVQSGRIGHLLAEVLISAKTKEKFPMGIILDVAPEGSNPWEPLSHADITPGLPNDRASPHLMPALPRASYASLDLALQSASPTHPTAEESKDCITQPSDRTAQREVGQDETQGKHTADLQETSSYSLAGSHIQHPQDTPTSDAEQQQESAHGDSVDEQWVPATTDKEKHAGAPVKKMEDWSEEDVLIWLKKEVQFSDDVISKFEGLDGFTLVRYTKAEMKEDLELPALLCRRLIMRREHYLEKERQGILAMTVPSESMTSPCLGEISDVSTHESKNTQSPTKIFSPSQEQAYKADDREPLKQTEDLQESGSSEHKSVKDSKEEEPADETLAPQVPTVREIPLVATARWVERGAIESSANKDVGYVSLSTSATPNPSDLDVTPTFFDRRQPLHPVSDLGGELGNSNTEKKLTNLLLGTDKGELDSSYYPVLVVNTPAQNLSPEDVENQFSFLSSVNWNVVFDCNEDSNRVGLCQYVNQRKSIKILSAETFSETKDVDALRDGIDFPEVPVWVFPNGRTDLNVKGMEKMSDMDWMRERSNSVLNTVRFFSDPGVIPPGRAVVVFLLLSDADTMVMTQLFREFYTSKYFKDLRRFTVIAENQGVLHKWIQHLDNQSIVSSKNMSHRCLGGVKWQEINTYMMRLMGSCETRLPELPMSPKGHCQLIKKHQSQWSDLSVLAKNECENTSMDESNPNFLDFVQEKESRFYQGHEVDWWNFYLSEETLNRGKGFNQVLKRQNYGKLHSDVNKILASLGKKVTHISMVTVFHEPGSGGTTVAKNLLWDLHREYRCAVVKRVTNDTVNQIVAFQKYGYEEGKTPGPVVLLLENLDSESLRPFLIGIEREIRYVENNRLAFILIHCKRTSEPQKLQKKEEPKPCLSVQHKLTDAEKLWFTAKTKDLEQRNVFSETETPELLLAFMVMKKECDPTYLKNVVKGILPENCKEAKKETLNAVNLVKYIAVVQMYKPDFAMPVSACDGFMQNQSRILISGGRRQTYGPWEKHRPEFLRLLLLEEFIQDIDGCVKGLTIVHPIVAAEIVDQLGEAFQQRPADIILELLEKSTILDTLSYSKGYIQKVCRDLMVRRQKKEYGDDKETDFAPFIEDVFQEDREMAFKIMEVGIKKFQDPFIAQQKARLHSKREDDPDQAEQAINIALGIVNNNSYLWDTKGIILRQKMTKYDRKEGQEGITDSEMKDLLDTFNESCQAFQNAQKAMEEETRRNYAGYVGEITTIAKLLEIMHKRVEPFCHGNEGLETLRRYLMTEYIPPDLHLPSLRDFSDTMKSLSERVDRALRRFTDYLVQCAEQRFGKTVYRLYERKLQKIYDARHRYFAISTSMYKDVKHYPIETAHAMRRSEIQWMHADGYQQIFDMASQNKVKVLKRVRDLLQANLDGPSLFDIKNYVFTLFALSVCTDEGLDEKEARKAVNDLKMMEEKSNGCYGLFFEMLLNWPDGKPREQHTPIADTIKQLHSRWRGQYRSKAYEESPHNLPRRSKIRQHQVHLKPTTEFYLGVEGKNSRFVHRKSIGRVTYAIWKEDSIKKSLRRLDGILDSKHYVLYNPEGEEPVKIVLSLPIKGLPSREPVQFYLGFSFAGPLAYDVVYKDNRETPFIAKESSSNYPSYVNELDDTDEGPDNYDL